MKRVFVVIFFFLSFSFIYWKTDGFLLSKVQSNLPHQAQWNINGQDFELAKSILDQRYTYLNKGHQSFVFASEDGKYVLKLINHSRFSRPSWLHMFPLPDFLDLWRQKYLAKRDRKYKESFNSFCIAMKKLAAQTGQIFVQLNRNNNFSKPLVIVDALGRSYELDLNSVEFILQKRVEMIYPALESLISEKGESEFRKGVVSFVDAIVTRAEKGIADDDLDVEINMGIIDKQAFIIDTGRFYFEPALQYPAGFEKEVRKSVRYFREWLTNSYPDQMQFFDKLLDKRIREYQDKLQAADLIASEAAA